MKKEKFFFSNQSRLYIPAGMVIIIAALLSGGCTHKNDVPKPGHEINKTAHFTDNQRQAEMLSRCSKELAALKKLNPGFYRRSNDAFTKLMFAASQYADIRNEVSEGTQGTVDSLYEYRTSKMCADISQALMTALTERGDPPK